MNLIAHSRTKSELRRYINRPTHSLILEGRPSSGKYFAGQWIAASLKINTFTIEPLLDKKVILIDQIRELYDLTKTGSDLIIIIKDAHTMGLEAQNAFLKLLEEPPGASRFILTIDSNCQLLPTIHSRASTIKILPPESEDAISYEKTISRLTTDEILNLWITTNEEIGFFISLLNDEKLFATHQQSVTDAKQFYASTPYKRHLMCITKNFDQQWIIEILGLMAIIVKTLVKQNTDNLDVLQRLTKQSHLIDEITNNLTITPGNAKIQVSKLIYNL